MILVVTNELDLTTDYLIERAASRNLPVFRLNTEKMTNKFRYGIHLSNQDSQVWMKDTCGRELSLRDISGVLYRRPLPPQAIPELDPEFVPYSVGEFLALIRGMFPPTRTRWMSYPAHIQAAENKLAQLYAAVDVGFLIPKTSVSNDKGFLLQNHNIDRNVIKPVRSGSVEVTGHEALVYASPAPSLASLPAENLTVTPTFIQEEVHPKMDVRITVIAKKCFATRISSKQPADAPDWRESIRNGDLTYVPIETPVEIQEKCFRLLEAFGLSFGAFDFAVTTNGKWYFLEVNPNGQWAWLDPIFQRGISDAILDFLSEETNG